MRRRADTNRRAAGRRFTREVLPEMTVVDLFSGCGGLSLGAQRAGVRVVAAIDNDPVLTSSYSRNFPQTHLLRADVATLDGDCIRALADTTVDGIVGGPPCQGFSEMGRRDPSDPRSRLLYQFFRVVMEMRPSFFLMENVRGLNYPATRPLLDAALQLVRPDYALLGPRLWNAADFGAATSRTRLFVIGIRKDRAGEVHGEDVEGLRRKPATVRNAIYDLDAPVSLGSDDGFDTWRLARRAGQSCAYAQALHAPDRCFTGHRTTVHSSRVTDRFATVPQGGIDPVGRHPRLAWAGQCPALRAGTGSDHGSHQALRPIHPDRPRVITVREAARLQGFPDWYRFHPTIWHSFRMIGNSVSPIMADRIFTAIRARLRSPAAP